MSAAGRPLEAAVARAAAHYEKLARAQLQKQHTPRGFGGAFIGQAPLDFKGWFEDERGQRPPCAIECKTTSDPRLDFSIQGGGIEEQQLDAIRGAFALGVQVWLIVEFSVQREVYRVDGRAIVEFAAAPWRASLSLAWMRANGELCKVSDYGHPKRAAVWWLDTRLHPERDVAGLEVAAERAHAAGNVVELYPQREKPKAALVSFRDMMASKPHSCAPESERLAWLNKFSEWQLERDIGEAKRTRAQAKKRLRGWGRR